MVGGSREHGAAVVIVMCSFNGVAFRNDQLDSFLAQADVDWRLYVSDDGSKDGTLALLYSFRNTVQAAGPDEGITASGTPEEQRESSKLWG